MIPVVDLSGEPSGVATAIDAACHRVGFFQVVGHGLDADVEATALRAYYDALAALVE